MAGIVAIPSILVVVLVGYVPLPDPLILVLLFGTWSGSFLLSLLWLRRRCHTLAVEHALLCRRCGRPLARADTFRSRRSRDYRAPFTVPERCPSCHVSVDEAASQEGGS
jgi:hypothetical protein